MKKFIITSLTILSMLVFNTIGLTAMATNGGETNDVQAIQATTTTTATGVSTLLAPITDT